jgi:hypothetical protein
MSVPLVTDSKKKSPKLTRKMRAVGEEVLVKTCEDMCRDDDVESTHIYPPFYYLPDMDIKHLLDHFHGLTDVEAVKQVVSKQFTKEQAGIIF